MQMRNQLINFREERDLGQKINATFSFIRKNFKPLTRHLLLIVAPFALVGGIFNGISQYRMFTLGPYYNQYDSWGAFNYGRQITSLHYWIAIFFMVVSFVLVSLTVCAYIVEYMDNNGEVEMAAVREKVKNHFVSTLYSGFGAFVLVLLGYVLLLIPGIYISVAFSMFVIIMVREELGFVDTLERCVDLVKGNWWATFGMVMVIMFIQYMFQMITGLPVFILGMMNAAQIPGSGNQVLMIAANSFAAIGGVLFYTISIIGIAFQYFNLVEVKEGVGYLAMADQIGMVQVENESEEDEY
jgi:hypothetical protein